MRLMFDASVPPMIPPAGYSAVAGYIGGDTPHVWTQAEWRRFKNLAKLPIFVRSNPGGSMDDAMAALERLYEIGCPPGSFVVWDMEISVQPHYLASVNRIMEFFGYKVLVYGSASTVFRNPKLSGYFVADYAGIGPFMFKGARLTQYANGTVYDSSALRWWLYRHLWR